jgi:hypothetical protein
MVFWRRGASQKKEEEEYEVPFEHNDDENYASDSETNTQRYSSHQQQNDNLSRPHENHALDDSEQDGTETGEFLEDDRPLSGPPPTQHVFQHQLSPQAGGNYYNRPGIPPQRRPVDPVFRAPGEPPPPPITNHPGDDHPMASGPPSKNAFVHLASPRAAAYQQSPLRYNTRERPLDPVFKAPAGSFPLLVEGEQKLRSPVNQRKFHVFDPSAASRISNAVDPMGLESSFATLDGGEAPVVAALASKPSPFQAPLDSKEGEISQPRRRPPTGKKQQTSNAPPPSPPPQEEPVVLVPEIPYIPMPENDNVVDSNPSQAQDDNDDNDVVAQDQDFVQVEPASEPELDTPEQQYHKWLEAQQKNQGNTEHADGGYQNEQEEVYQGQGDADEDYQYVQEPDKDEVDYNYNQDDHNGQLVETGLSDEERAYEEPDNDGHVEVDPAGTKSEDEAVDYEEDQQYHDQDGLFQGEYEEGTEVIEYEQDEPPETPDHPIKYSRFVFVSDQKNVPDDMKKLEERAMRRRRDFLARMHDLECQLAMTTCQYAEEKMDLELAIHDTMDRMVCSPLELTMERVVMKRETSTMRAPAVASIQRRVSELDTLMTSHIHITMNNLKRDELDSLQDHLLHDTTPGMRMENSKADRVERGIALRFELIAGTDARRFHEESAARRAAVDMVSQKADNRALQEEERLDDFLATVMDLRAQLREERARRKAADMKILDDIAKTTATMKRALLEAVGGSN